MHRVFDPIYTCPYLTIFVAYKNTKSLIALETVDVAYTPCFISILEVPRSIVLNYYRLFLSSVTVDFYSSY